MAISVIDNLLTNSIHSFFNFFFFWVWLTDNVTLVLGMQLSDSARLYIMLWSSRV